MELLKIKEDILSITASLSEAIIDSFLSDGLFKDIPIIGTSISVGKLIHNISDRLLLIRLLSFINELEIKSQEDVDKIKEKYFKDKDYHRIGSKLLSSLEKVDEIKKVKWLAKLFRIYLDKKINKKQFLRISSIINNSYVDDVEQISVFRERDKITSHNDLVSTYILDHLYIIGLLENNGIDGGDFTGTNSGIIYSLNEFGVIFLNELI